MFKDLPEGQTHCYTPEEEMRMEFETKFPIPFDVEEWQGRYSPKLGSPSVVAALEAAVRYTHMLEAWQAAITTKQAERKQTAKEEFDELGGDEDMPPLERLRFFCSLAMKGQDWLDVEPFFDGVTAELSSQAEQIRKLEEQRDGAIEQYLEDRRISREQLARRKST